MANKSHDFLQFEVPITGKYAVIQMQKFSELGNVELSIDTQYVTFLPKKIIFQEKGNDLEYDVVEIYLNETETQLIYLITTTQNQYFLLHLNQDELFETSLLNLAKITNNDEREGVMFGLHKSLLAESIEETYENIPRLTFITEVEGLEKEEKLIPYRKKDKWGFCTEDKIIVIDCVYDEVALFSKTNKAVVKLNGREEYINKKGEIIDYRDLYEYSDYKEYKYWDPFNDCPSEYEFKYCYSFVENGKYYVISPTNMPENYNEENIAPIQMINNGMYGFINSKGKLVIDFIYSYADFFYEDVAMISTRDFNAFINKSGDYIFPPKKDIGYGHFSDGLAYCVNSDGWGFINKEGEIVIPCIYYGGSDFSEGLANVKFAPNGKYGYINKQGIAAIPFKYDSCGKFIQGMGIVGIKNNDNTVEYGFIDLGGKIVIPIIYEFVSAFENGFSKVKLNSKWGYINRKGVQYWE